MNRTEKTILGILFICFCFSIAGIILNERSMVYLEQRISNLENQENRTSEKVAGMRNNIFDFSIPVRVSAYSPSVEECDNDPYITASQDIVKVGICAISRDIESALNLHFGDLIILKGIGTFEFLDRMNRDIKTGVDIFFKTKTEAINFGVVEGVKMTVIRRK